MHFEHGEPRGFICSKSTSSNHRCTAKAVLDLKKCDIPPVYIGTRHGEKLYEVLVTQEEMTKQLILEISLRFLQITETLIMISSLKKVVKRLFKQNLIIHTIQLDLMLKV